MKKRALISVSDKTGILEFAKKLNDLGYEILSTGGTAKAISDGGVPVTKISEVTGFPEILDGRVKTLHPKIHGGLLAMKDNPKHMEEIKTHDITPIDIVAINLYPFRATIEKPDVTLDEAIENIDIGGPAMLRASAKNYKNVAVIINPSDYDVVLQELENRGEVSLETKLKLSYKVFSHTAHYDALIQEYLRLQVGEDFLSEKLVIPYEKAQDMRYGENPHQRATFYKEIKGHNVSLAMAKQIHGKELSFNNINDANGALELLLEFDQTAVIAVKHANTCGVATGSSVYEAYIKAYQCDPVSIFGGIVAFNREVDKKTAEELNKIFVEIVLAPSYEKEALEVLKSKKNIRIMEINLKEDSNKPLIDLKKVRGGLLVQDFDAIDYIEKDLKVVTNREPSTQEWEDLKLAWKVVKHVKSNAIVLTKDGMTVGIGPGQVNRIWATENAIRQAGDLSKGSALASDAFFPFPDVVQSAAKAGVTAIIHPGGSLKDQDSVDEADKNNIAMVLTGIRHFKH